MRIKHNKKRNTAFVYEALVRENTIAILKGDKERQQKIVEVLKKHFNTSGVLKRDLDCYQSLYENKGLDLETNKRILKESKLQKHLIDDAELFEAQTDLIHDINKTISTEVFSNFVPNYKSLATIDQIFSISTSPKNRVILENQLMETLSQQEDSNAVPSQIDNVVYRSFVKKFNEKYDNELLEEQKQLLSLYITSFSDNALSLKTYLNEEIARLKGAMKNASLHENIKDDLEMIEKSEKILDKLQSYANENINESLLSTVLKTQKLVKEIQSDGSDN